MADDRSGWDRAWTDTTIDDEVGTLSYGWIQPSLEFIQRHLVGGAPVLEAGCGLGRFIYWLGEEGYDAVGIDCSLAALAKARSAFPHARLALADVRQLPFGASTFGTCLSFGVIEHYSEAPDVCLAEMHRVLQPEGVLVLSVPHLHLLARIDPPLKAAYRALRRMPAPEAAPEPPGYYWRLADLTDALARNRYEVLEVMPFGHAYSLHSFCGLFRRRGAYHDVTPLAARLGRVMARVVPWSGAFFAFVAARKSSVAPQGGPADAPRG